MEKKKVSSPCFTRPSVDELGYGSCLAQGAEWVIPAASLPWKSEARPHCLGRGKKIPR